MVFLGERNVKRWLITCALMVLGGLSTGCGPEATEPEELAWLSPPGGKADNTVGDDPAGQGTPGWQVKAETSPRNEFTATLLKSGKILIAGGMGESTEGETDSVELYDPVADTWTTLASMATPRFRHAAVRLADGRVLVTGGYGFQVKSLKQCEIYDPATDTWSEVAPLNKVRYFHTATLLADGRVLVLGGQHKPQYFTETDSEIYDPATDTWTLVARATTGRQQHTSHLLGDGRVLVVGGYNQALKRGVPAVEIYDPVADTWEWLGELEFPRWDHDAVMLPGGRLIIGGGQSNYFDANAHVELVDLDTRQVRTLPPMGVARKKLSITRAGAEQLVVLGGGLRYGADLASTPQPPAELFDVTRESWSTGAAQPLELSFHRAIPTVNSGVVVIGFTDIYSSPNRTVALTYGLESGEPLTQLPTVSQDHWIYTQNLGEEVRAYHHGVVFDHNMGALINFPGRKEEHVPIGTYIWRDGGWRELLPAAVSPGPPRIGHTMAYDRARGRLVMFGGKKRQNFLLNDVWEFDGQTWEQITPANGVTPPASYGAQLVYDTTREEMLLLPGKIGLTQQHTIYTWDGAIWQEKPQQIYQPWKDQRDYDAAYDEKRGRLVLYQQGQYLTENSETWEFDGTSWSNIHSGGMGNRSSTALAYDPFRGGVVLYGGSRYNPYGGSLTEGDTWFFDGAWKQLSPVGEPGGRAGHCLAYDHARGRMVVDDVAWPVGNGKRFELRAVAAPNRAPGFKKTVGKKYTLHVNEAFTLPLEAWDEDGHPLELTVTGLPTGASYTLDAEGLSWTPREGEAGVYSITITVTDGARVTTRQTGLTVEGLFSYGCLPQGAVAHTATTTMAGQYGDPPDMEHASFSIRCEFRGQNPGLVKVSCFFTTPDWPYSTHGAGIGLVDGDCTFNTGGVNGRLESLQWDDYQMVVTRVDTWPFTNRHATAYGEGKGYLDPLP